MLETHSGQQLIDDPKLAASSARDNRPWTLGGVAGGCTLTEHIGAVMLGPASPSSEARSLNDGKARGWGRSPGWSSTFVVDRLERCPFMVKVGDRIRLSSGKGPDREGVVAAVTGSMVRVRWPSEQETTVIPAPGTLTVLASSGDQARPAVRPERAAEKKAAPKKTATAKKDVTKKSTTSKQGATKKTKGTKRSSR